MIVRLWHFNHSWCDPSDWLWLNARMFKPLPVFIGSRYTRARRRNQFISFISLLSLLGLGLGVAVLITVISVMNGFEAEIRQRTLAAVPHLLLEGDVGGRSTDLLERELAGDPDIHSISPYVGGKGMISVPGIVRGIKINGVNPQRELASGVLRGRFVAGSMEALSSGEFGIVIGAISANHLGLRLGDKLRLTLPKLSVTPMGIFPRVKRFTIVGIFEVGAQVDATDVFIHIDDAARLFQLAQSPQGYRLQLDNLFAAPKKKQELINRYQDQYRITDWSESQGGLFQAIQMEKRVMGFLLMIVVLVAVFNIISIVVMMVAEKRAAISVLRTMGMRAHSVVMIFITQGSLIGLLGVSAGVAIGVFLALNISQLAAMLESVTGRQLFDPTVYHIVYLPSLLRWSDVWVIAGSAFALSILATLYPAWQAAKVKAAEVLRYE